MTGLDTNVLVRFLTGDDPEQARRARRRFEAGEVWIAKTVLIETEWVLRSAYGFSRGTLRTAFRKLLGYPDLGMEDRSAVLRALDWYQEGLDFADALHLASNGVVDRFATFDEALVRSARSLEGAPAVDPA